MRKGGIYYMKSPEGESRFIMAVGPVASHGLWHGIVVDIMIQPEKIAIFDPAFAEDIGFDEDKQQSIKFADDPEVKDV